MNETIESVSKWADETFGPSTPGSSLRRAIVEIDELIEKYESVLYDPVGNVLVEEAADVCITLYRYIYLVDPEAINKKMAINRKRKWKVTGEGVGQHYDERESNP